MCIDMLFHAVMHAPGRIPDFALPIRNSQAQKMHYRSKTVPMPAFPARI